jgi:hypothetical protein
MKGLSIPAAKAPLAFAGMLILAFSITPPHVAEAKPKKVTVMNCTSAEWPGTHTPEMERCQMLGSFELKAGKDITEVHSLICFSDGTAKCCYGDTCTSVRLGAKRPFSGAVVPETRLSP